MARGGRKVKGSAILNTEVPALDPPCSPKATATAAALAGSSPSLRCSPRHRSADRSPFKGQAAQENTVTAKSLLHITFGTIRLPNSLALVVCSRERIK